jgi:DNA-binding PadR family transcriptional regulator
MSPEWPQFGPVRAKRFFEKGVLRFVLLDLLKDQPAHGYDLIKIMEERSHGFYTPSTGSIYPILQTLQDHGYVTSAEKTGKKVYTITDHGLSYLKEHADIIDGIHNVAALKGRFDQSEWRGTAEELRRVRQSFGRRASSLTCEQKEKIRGTVTEACRKIESIIEND